MESAPLEIKEEQKMQSETLKNMGMEKLQIIGSEKKFVPADKERLIEAHGQKSLKKEDYMTRMAFEDIDDFWQPIEEPQEGDYLYEYPDDGWKTFKQFQPKFYKKGHFDTIYIQPILARSVFSMQGINDENMESLKNWLEAYFQPCKVVILQNILESTLGLASLGIDQEDGCKPGQTKYNAIHILKKVIAPIYKAKVGAIGVLAITDVDLYTKKQADFCYGIGVPALGVIQSIRRYQKDIVVECFDSQEERDSQTLQRMIKICTQNIGHMFGISHCTWYECLMKGTNNLKQIDAHPPYLCPVCYRKLHKCLDFDHVKRYGDLANLCTKFGQTFTKSQNRSLLSMPKEKENKTYADWFQKRHDFLAEKQKEREESKSQRSASSNARAKEYLEEMDTENMKIKPRIGSARNRPSSSSRSKGSKVRKSSAQSNRSRGSPRNCKLDF